MPRFSLRSWSISVYDMRIKGFYQGEGGLDLDAESRLVGFHRKKIGNALHDDGLGDDCIGRDGVEGDERALQRALGAGHSSRGGMAASSVTLLHGLRDQHQPRGNGEGRDRVKRDGALSVVMAAARDLAVDDGQPSFLRSALAHPFCECGGEQRHLVRCIRTVGQRSHGSPCS